MIVVSVQRLLSDIRMAGLAGYTALAPWTVARGASFVSGFGRFTFHERRLLAARWPRVHPRSDGHLDSCDPLYAGAEITETGCG